MFSPEFGLQIRQKAKFLMECQARTGVNFDVALGIATYHAVCAEMKELEEKLAPHLPDVTTTKGNLIKVPKRRFRTGKNGLEKSADILKFEEAQGVTYTIEELQALPEPHYLNPTSAFDLWSNTHQLELKQLLMAKFGWRPYFWNYKKGKDGKPVYDDKKQKIKVSPKFQDQGKLCPNLEALGDSAAFVQDIVLWTQKKHRRGVLKKKDGTGGWLGNPRLDIDGRISARSSGLTNTLRQKHTEICNVPKPDVHYGDKLRAMCRVPEGKVAVGYDAGSLEAVIKAHYAFKYDGGEYARKIEDPAYDDHIDVALSSGLITPEMARLFTDHKLGKIPDEVAKANPLWKPMKSGRTDAKPVNYGAQYGQQIAGLAEATGWSIEKATLVWETYWELNHGWKKCQQNLVRHWEQMDRRGIYCPISGLFLHSRSKNSLGSLLIQHTGAFIMDYAGVILDKWLGGIKTDRDRPYYKFKGYECARVIYYHDEYMWESDPEIAEELLEMGKESIREAARRLKLRVPLDADGAIGLNWAEVH